MSIIISLGLKSKRYDHLDSDLTTIARACPDASYVKNRAGSSVCAGQKGHKTDLILSYNLQPLMRSYAMM